MNQHSTHDVDTQSHLPAHDDFLARFKKNLLSEILLVQKYAANIFNTLKAFFVGVLLFIFEFALFKEVLSIIVPPVAIFFAGKYLTFLPMYLVIPFSVFSMFFPPAPFAVIVGLSAFFNLFIVFLS